MKLLAFVIVACLHCVGAVQAQQPTKPSGSISGRVTHANKGIAGATVSISKSGDALSGRGLTLKSTTDEEGRFRISNLTAGTYYVWPFVPSFVIAESTGGYPMGKAVTVADAEDVDDVDFHLTGGGVITGKVTDAAGRPVIDERIHLMPIGDDVMRLATSIYPSINEIRTDDRGVYRCFGLPAGKYKVALGDEYAAFTSTTGRRFFPRTYHPDVTDEAKAKIIELTEGEEELNVDINVARLMNGFAVSGRFVDGDNGKPVPNIGFGLSIIIGGRTQGFMSSTGLSTSDGGFRVDNLPPGRYAISVMPRPGSSYSGESPPFDIVDSDVTDLETKIHRGAMVSGNVLIEGAADRSVAAKFAQTRVETVMWNEDGNGFGTLHNANINPDGSFEVGPLQPGKATFRLTALDRNAPAEFTLMSIDHNGVDKSGGLQIKAGDNITGLRLIAAYGTGTIRGNIRVEGGALPENTFVDVSFFRPGNAQPVKYQQVDARGRFVFERVPPGNYELRATVYLNNKQVTTKQSVVASNGTVTEVTLTVNLNESPTPKP
jgi:hypothetical protein